MRRKSERTAGKKAKASPEKKIEKVKRTRSKRKKQSTSSENESGDEASPVCETEIIVDSEKKPPQTPVKEDSPEETQDQVWKIKASEGSGDKGEIKKLKICLTRPPSTPERAERSPRSRRKHSRATSSSDTPSIEPVEDRRKSRHRSRRAHRGSKDGSDKNDSQGEDLEGESVSKDSTADEVSQSETAETPMSTTSEDTKSLEKSCVESSQDITQSSMVDDKTSPADTTVVSPKPETDPSVLSNTESDTTKSEVATGAPHVELATVTSEQLVTKETEMSSNVQTNVTSNIESHTVINTDETNDSSPEVDSPKAPSPEPLSPRVASPKLISSEGELKIISPEPVSPESVIKASSPKSVSPKEATLEQVSLEPVSSPKMLPKADSPQVDSLQAALPKATSTEDASSEAATQQDTESLAASQEAASPNVAAPKAVSPKPNAFSNEAVHSPKSDSVSESNKRNCESPIRERRDSMDKSDLLELHAEESKCETSDIEMDKSQDEDETASLQQVSKSEDKSDITAKKISSNENKKAINEHGVVESNKTDEKAIRNNSTESKKQELPRRSSEKYERCDSRDKDVSESHKSNQEDITQNGQSAPIVVSRKRRWGARPKLNTQNSITISTDVLKEIIPDVKPVEFEEVIEDKKQKREVREKVERPVLPKIVIDNTENVEQHKIEKDKDSVKVKEANLALNRKISIVKENDSIMTRPPSPPRHKQSCILYITNLVRPFTLPQLKNLLQRTGKIVDGGFWIDKIKSKCYVKYEMEDQAVETRHALHGVTWPVSNPKTLQVDFSSEEAFEKAKLNEDADNAQASTIPGTVEDWLREQDMKRERGEAPEKPWERKPATREWDLGKNEKEKDKETKDKGRRDDRPQLTDKRRNRSVERSPEPARKFKKKEEEAPAKLLDDLFKKTKTTPCIYWLPLSAETIAIKEEQRRQHMAEHERRLQEQRRTHRRH